MEGRWAEIVRLLWCRHVFETTLLKHLTYMCATAKFPTEAEKEDSLKIGAFVEVEN